MIKIHHPTVHHCLVSTPLKRRGRLHEASVERWISIKKRRANREAADSKLSHDDKSINEAQNTRSISCQTDLTMADISALEDDNLSRQQERHLGSGHG